MFLLAYFFWLCLFNSCLAYPWNQYKDPDLRAGIWSGQADYPDLTRGLTDAEVKASLQGIPMDDLKNVAFLINEQITEMEEEYKASLRAQSNKNFRAVGSSLDDGCREDNESDEPKQVSRCKPQTCPTTKRFMKPTTTTPCVPKTTRTTKPDFPKPTCAPKPTYAPKTTTCGSMDIFAKWPKVNNRRKKSKEDNEWESDYFQSQAGKRMEKGKNIFQELDLPGGAPAKYKPAAQDLWADFDPANWEDIEQTDSDRQKLATWASLNPASLANIENANLDLAKWAPQQNNFEMEKHAYLQPAQEQQATFQMENQNHNFKQDNQAKLEQGNQAPSVYDHRANLQLQNQGSFDQIHRDSFVRDYHQADLNLDQPQHQDRELRSEVNLQPSGHQLSRKRNAEQERQAFIPYRKQQHSDVNYHPRQWAFNEPLTSQEKLNKVEGEPAPFELSGKRNAAQESQASMPQGATYREQQSEVKYHPRAKQWRRVSVQEKKQLVTNNNEAQPVNSDLAKQGSHFDVDRFLAKSAHDPPRYLNSMQNDRIQRENERRLNKDRSLSESLNLDKLAGKKMSSPVGESEWAVDNKRGKRESTDDAPENSKETYLKKLMESFPRDQGSQINANVALKDCPFAHERMKRS